MKRAFALAALISTTVSLVSCRHGNPPANAASAVEELVDPNPEPYTPRKKPRSMITVAGQNDRSDSVRRIDLDLTTAIRKKEAADCTSIEWKIREGAVVVRATSLSCSTTLRPGVVLHGVNATHVAMFQSSGGAPLITFPPEGVAAPAVLIDTSTTRAWSVQTLREVDGVVSEITTANTWQRRPNAKAPFANAAPELPNGSTAVGWIFGVDARKHVPTSDVVALAHVGGTNGTGYAWVALENGGTTWKATPFWPSKSRTTTAPQALRVDAVTPNGSSNAPLIFSYRDYSVKSPLFVEPEGSAQAIAIEGAPSGTEEKKEKAINDWRIARVTGNVWPVVAATVGPDINVAVRGVNAHEYVVGVVPGDLLADLSRRPPRRTKDDPVRRSNTSAGSSSPECSETVERIEGDLLSAPAPIHVAQHTYLLYLRQHVEKTHRWTLIPSTEAPLRCDWIPERSLVSTSLVVAALGEQPTTTTATPTARILAEIALPFMSTTAAFSNEQILDVGTLKASSAQKTNIDVIAGGPGVTHHLVLDAQALGVMFGHALRP